MPLTVNSYKLSINYGSPDDKLTQALQNYNHLISRVFTPLPAQGKLLELAKRLSLIALPLIYPLLGICWLGAQAYYKAANWWCVRGSIDSATQRLANSLITVNRGQGPYEYAAIVSIQSQGLTLYSDLITMQSDQYEGGRLPFFVEKLQERKCVIQENLKEIRFNIGHKLEVKWLGLLKNGEGRILTTEAHCDWSLRIGESGEGEVGAWHELPKIREIYLERLQTLNVLHPEGCQHFASP